ncbi:MAG: hypothetical protein R6V85_17380 [Polyangia bacterium]
MGCPYRTLLDLRALDDDTLVPAEDDDSERLFQVKGDEHERSYLEKLERERGRVAAVEPSGSLEERAARTMDAMRSGADVVFQATLLDHPWRGYADFLIKVESHSNLGAFSYEVAGTKLARTARPKHVVQISVYSGLLEKIQGAMPKRMHLVLGDETTVSFRTDSVARYVDRACRRLEEFAASSPSDLTPDPCV